MKNDKELGSPILSGAQGFCSTKMVHYVARHDSSEEGDIHKKIILWGFLTLHQLEDSCWATRPSRSSGSSGAVLCSLCAPSSFHASYLALPLHWNASPVSPVTSLPPGIPGKHRNWPNVDSAYLHNCIYPMKIPPMKISITQLC